MSRLKIWSVNRYLLPVWDKKSLQLGLSFTQVCILHVKWFAVILCWCWARHIYMFFDTLSQCTCLVDKIWVRIHDFVWQMNVIILSLKRCTHLALDQIFESTHSELTNSEYGKSVTGSDFQISQRIHQDNKKTYNKFVFFIFILYITWRCLLFVSLCDVCNIAYLHVFYRSLTPRYC